MPPDQIYPNTEATEGEEIVHHLQEDNEENDYGDFYFIPDMHNAVDWND